MSNGAEEILRKYLPGPFKSSGSSNIITRCPFHKNGQEGHPSFIVNLVRGTYKCFTGYCAVNGSLEHLLVTLGVSPSIAKMELKGLEFEIETNNQFRKLQFKNQFKAGDPYLAKTILPDILLSAYDFPAQDIIADGFSQETINHFQVGYDIKQNRITYPVRDMYGNLAGMSTRSTSLSKDQEPRYRVYQGAFTDLYGQKRSGDYGNWFNDQFPGYAFNNHDFLWNFDKVWKDVRGGTQYPYVILVEGFKACMWVRQCGFPNVVALMGSKISYEQRLLLQKLSLPVCLMLDNNPAGKEGAIKVGSLLWKMVYGRLLSVSYPMEDLEISTQPDDYDKETISWMLHNRKTFTDLKFIQKRKTLLKEDNHVY
jgi:DNA primase